MRSTRRSTTCKRISCTSCAAKRNAAREGGIPFLRGVEKRYFSFLTKEKSPETLRFRDFFGPSVIIGFQKTQIYQRFAGSQQEVFILKILEFENNAAQQDNGRRCSFLNVGTNCPKLVPLKHGPGGISPVAAYRSEQPGAVCQGCITPMFIGDLPLTGAPGCSAFCCKL